MKEREAIIKDYIDGYNQFDIDKMVADLDAHVIFENISNGEQTMMLTGRQAFREQAEQARHYFTQRTQSVRAITHHNDESQIEIEYHAILATDFPNGMKKGDELKMEGRSIFRFSGEKIIRLTDIS